MFLDRLVQNNTRVHLLVMGITIYANRYRNTHQGLLASFPIPIQVRQLFFSFPVATRASRESFDNNEDGEHWIISFRQTLSFFSQLAYYGRYILRADHSDTQTFRLAQTYQIQFIIYKLCALAPLHSQKKTKITHQPLFSTRNAALSPHPC